MANSIALAKVYAPLLDEVYKQASLTSILDGAADLAREGINANEIAVPKLSMDGLANYSRNSGYVDGDVTLTWETIKAEFDRGRMFSVDELDNMETGGVAFGRLAGEFIRTQVVPELDAYRIAKYASTEGISTAEATIAKGEDAIKALRTATKKMDDDEVYYDDRILFATPDFLGMIEDLDTTKSRAVMSRFAQVIQVPSSRLVTKITQKDGTTSGQTSGGWTKATDGKDLHFLIVQKAAAIQFNKLVKPKIIAPEANQHADAWKYGYRLCSLCDVYENKVAGVYACTAKAASSSTTGS